MKAQLEAFMKHFGYKANSLEKIVSDPKDGNAQTTDPPPENLPAPVDPAAANLTAPTDPEGPDEPTFPGEPSKEDYGKLVELNELVKELGGVEKFKALLLNAAAIVANHQSAEEVEKVELVKTIVANSGSSMTEEDLQSVPVSLLSKMAEGLRPAQRIINYGPLAAGHMQQNAEDAIPAPRLRFLIPAPQEDA